LIWPCRVDGVVGVVGLAELPCLGLPNDRPDETLVGESENEMMCEWPYDWFVPEAGLCIELLLRLRWCPEMAACAASVALVIGSSPASVDGAMVWESY
jgi:hypothetical protein